jgi:ribosomal protein RSM22 (predicted rRNA methylase)
VAIQPFPFHLSEVRSSLLVNALTDDQIVRSIRKTHKNFTTNREKIQEYSKSELDVSSYSLFYMPTDFPKLSMILDQVSSKTKKVLSTSEVDVFDLGCGPGTFSLAWHHYFKNLSHRFHFLDQSSEMLNQARIFSRELFELPFTRFHKQVGELDSSASSRLRVAIFGNSINEMGLSAANKYLKAIKPDFVLIIGPGTPEVFRLFMEWKNSYSSNMKYKILYPCLKETTCPILACSDRDDWCHQILRTKLTPELHQLGQKLSIDRRSVPFIGHLYSRESFDENMRNEDIVSCYTLVRFLGQTKFSWRYLACPAGSKHLIELELMKKLSTKSQVERVLTLCVGDRVDFKLAKEISPMHLRGTIK